MANRNDFQIRVFGLEELEQLELSIDGAKGRFVRGVATDLAAELAAASPDDGGHRLADSWKGRAISDTLASVESDHPAAKARDRGAYIVGKRGQVIRFRNSFGDLVFARFVRQKGTHYTRRGLAKRRVIAEAVFEREFDQLKTKAI